MTEVQSSSKIEFECFDENGHCQPWMRLLKLANFQDSDAMYKIEIVLTDWSYRSWKIPNETLIEENSPKFDYRFKKWDF